MIIFALASLLLLTDCYSLALPADAESTIEGTGSWRAGTFTNTGNTYISLPVQGSFSNSAESRAYASGTIAVTDAQNAVSIYLRPYGYMKEHRTGMTRFVIEDAETGEELGHGYGDMNNSSCSFYNRHSKTLVDAFIKESDVIISVKVDEAVYRLPVSPAGFINATRQYLLK